MSSTRLGYLDFINCLPVYYGTLTGAVDVNARIIKGFPNQLNASLAAGDLDISPVSSIEYARHQDEYLLLSDICLNSEGPVKSVVLISKFPLEMLEGKSVALPTTSATSSVLLKILLSHLNISYSVQKPELNEMLQASDAALLIGDDALRIKEKSGITWQETASKQAADISSPAVSSQQSVSSLQPSASSLQPSAFSLQPSVFSLQPSAFSSQPTAFFLYDLAELWQRKTGFPVVFAVWAVRKDYARQYPEILEDITNSLRKSLNYGLAHIDKIIDMVLPDFPGVDLFDYFKNLRYEFGAREREGLLRYYDYAFRLGLCDRCEGLVFDVR